MLLLKRKPTSPGVRHRTKLKRTVALTQAVPEKSLIKGAIKRRAGRNQRGKVTIRHQGGGEKQLMRQIDFKRDKKGIIGRVVAIEYDPLRRASLARIYYQDGEKRYILAPAGLKVGDLVVSSEDAEMKIGNALPLAKIPVGTPIHNIEIYPGKGGQLVRGAGTSALIQSKESGFATVQLPSREERLLSLSCFASIGQVGNEQWKTVKLGKAGRSRHMGIRPSVRGVAMHPAAHPHGGGEGRSGIGMPSPKSPWGKPTLGKKTRKRRKYSDRFIVKDRRVR